MSRFRKITVIGLGVIGSSIARAARARGLAQIVTGVDSNEITLGYARKHGVADETDVHAGHAASGSDIIIIATPTHMLSDVCRDIAPYLKEGTLVMDTGSVKQAPLAVMTKLLAPHALVVPSHPIAGSEQSGIAAGREDLLEKKRVVITPQAPLTHGQLQQVNNFWEALGARVEAMPADMHDMIYGYVSHLPQWLAFACTPLVAATENEIEGNATLKRFLRIGASDKALWQGIFRLNRDVLLTAADRYMDVIAHIRRELATAPQETQQQSSDAARLVLFPRIVASCLVTTVMEAEKKAGLPFARFSGAGFADFTAPAITDPEKDIENIASHYAQVGALLDDFAAVLLKLRKTLE